MLPLTPRDLVPFVRKVTLAGYLRVMAREHDDPLGMGYGNTRFSSPVKAFKLLYAAADIGTAVAETVIRDRFEAVPIDGRVLERSEIARWRVTEVATTEPLRVLDLRGPAAFRLGIDTDAMNARNHAAGQAASQAIHDTDPAIDGLLYRSRLSAADCLAVYDRAVARALRGTAPIPLSEARRLVPALAALSIRLNEDPE